MFAVTFSAAGAAASFVPEAKAQTALPAPAAGPYPDPDFRQVDSWIVIHQDDTATFYVGKTDCGQGTGTAFRQIMSDELDFPYDRTTCIMGSTDITVDQGGSGGSTAMERDSWPMRRVAAEARRVLLEMASAKLGRACRPVERERGRDYGDGRSFEARHLRTTDRRKEIQRRGEGEQYQRDCRRGRCQAGTGVQKRWPVPPALRHSRQGGRFAEMGGGRQAARHGSRPQCEAAVRGGEADQHR